MTRALAAIKRPVRQVRTRLAISAAVASRRLGSPIGVAGDLGGEWSIPPDCDAATAETIKRVQAYTLTPPARIMALCDAVRYIEGNGIDGAIVECGVWRGGSMMAAALTLIACGATERDLYLYDTFSEMPPPGPHDSHISGADLQAQHEQAKKKVPSIYEIYPRDRVAQIVQSTGYPAERLHFVEGLVEDTIPAEAPERVALCRLDTDYYSSTAHELEHLYPRIAPGGVLIIDDYGDFGGARKAVDDYLEGLEPRPLMSRVDATCRLLVV